MLDLNRVRRKTLFQAEGVHYVMGTLLKVCVQAEDLAVADQAKESIFAEVQRLEELLSVYKSTSELSQVNARAGEAPVPLSPETFDVLSQSISFAQLADGACDPTIGPLVRLWQAAGKRGCFPAQADIEEARGLVDYRRIQLDPDLKTAFLPERGMGLDLGWIGKGYAMDRALRMALWRRVNRISMDFGGQLLFWKRDAFGTERIWVDVPGLPPERLPAFGVHANGSISTTSQAERYLLLRDKEGRFLHVGHVVNPRTGHPADRLESVTVVARTATEADALSTAVFVLGIEGFPLLRKVVGTEAWVLRKGKPLD